MSVMVLGSENSIIKAKIARRQHGEIAFPNAMKRLTESEYEKITKRTELQNHSADYLQINGNPMCSYRLAKSYLKPGTTDDTD